MKVCHVCKAECDDAAELCPVCGADLTAEIAAEEEKEEKVINNPVLLATLDDVVSAEDTEGSAHRGRYSLQQRFGRRRHNESNLRRLVCGGGYLC